MPGLQARGFSLDGMVQTNSDRPGSHHCDMDVRVLPGGPVIAEALARGTPVLLGVNALNQKAFDDYSSGYAEEIASDAKGLAAWFEQSQRRVA